MYKDMPKGEGVNPIPLNYINASMLIPSRTALKNLCFARKYNHQNQMRQHPKYLA